MCLLSVCNTITTLVPAGHKDQGYREEYKLQTRVLLWHCLLTHTGSRKRRVKIGLWIKALIMTGDPRSLPDQVLSEITMSRRTQDYQ